MVMIARELFTLFCFVSFMLILWYAYSKRNKTTLDSVGRSVIEDDDDNVVEVPVQSSKHS